MKKRGRPASDDKLYFHTVGLTADEWEWLALWFPGASPTVQLRGIRKK